MINSTRELLHLVGDGDKFFGFSAKESAKRTLADGPVSFDWCFVFAAKEVAMPTGTVHG